MKFVAFERAKPGTGASRRLRITGRTPGIVYGGNLPAQLIELDHNALWYAIKTEAFHASVLEMELGDAVSPVLLRDVQMHPFKPLILHIDFQRVTAETRMHKKVPLHFTGAEESPAVKLDHCIVNHVVTELDVQCLPADLPEFIEVDISGLKKGVSLNLNDIAIPKGLKVITHGKTNPVIVSAVMVAAGTEEPGTEATAPAAEAAPAPAAKAAAKPAAKAPPAKKK